MKKFLFFGLEPVLFLVTFLTVVCIIGGEFPTIEGTTATQFGNFGQ
jgi:hypothetical protein